MLRTTIHVFWLTLIIIFYLHASASSYISIGIAGWYMKENASLKQTKLCVHVWHIHIIDS